MTKPFRDTLWMHCLFELYDKAKRESKEHLNFSEVDALVIEKSKSITEWKEEVSDENR